MGEGVGEWVGVAEWGMDVGVLEPVKVGVGLSKRGLGPDGEVVKGFAQAQGFKMARTKIIAALKFRAFNMRILQPWGNDFPCSIAFFPGVLFHLAKKSNKYVFFP